MILQKRCLRIITLSKARDHTDPLYDKLNLLKLHEINIYLMCKFMYKWYHDQLPTVFLNIFNPIANVHSHGTRQKSQLYCSKIKTNLGKTRLSYRAPYVWNLVLRAKINPDTSECVFSKTIKRCIKVGILWVMRYFLYYICYTFIYIKLIFAYAKKDCLFVVFVLYLGYITHLCYCLVIIDSGIRAFHYPY